jgi:uncharacterized phage infection (PIP) family protein YhgE
VTDLWHAVATAPEKLAEIMPGMLLVVGLLGTFLGLGLALNHASSILSQANVLSAGAAADSMQNLLGLLQGLGTKFKTSTWGILGFVLLKIWSEVTRFEEKRLAWVIGKVKDELEARKKAKAAAQDARQQALFENIGHAAGGIVQGFTQQVDLLIKSNQAMQLQQLQQLHRLEQSSEGVRADLSKVALETQTMCTAMSEFTQGTQEVVANMDAAAQRMASGANKVGAGADKVGAGATALVEAIEAFEHQFTGVLDNVRTDLGKAIQDMSAQASETLEKGSKQLGDATREISVALDKLSKDVKNTMTQVGASVNEALEIQRGASIQFTASSQVLNDNIAATNGLVENVTKSIEDGLESVASGTRNMRSLAQAVEKSSAHLDKVMTGLTSLPEALVPLGGLRDDQQALVAALRPLPEIVKVQQAVLEVVRALQEERSAPAPASNAELS